MAKYPQPKLFKPSEKEISKAAKRLAIESMKGRNKLFKKKIEKHAEN